MLLVTFHGGSDNSASDGNTSTDDHSCKPINNIYGYSTKDGTLETETALTGLPSHVKLDELRAMAVYQHNLYVVSGSKSNSYVLVFEGPPKKGPQFKYLDRMIGYGQSIMHPFAVAFDPASPNCYVSNQDSNVVAQVNLATGKHGVVTGTLAKGSQSNFLNGKYSADAFLDGTFVASQNGNLVDVATVAPSVTAANGGLNVSGMSKGQGQPLAPANSVRDVAIANDILIVCDEVDKQINLYTLADGTFLGSASANGNGPTHLAINGGGLWVSADENLYWSALPTSSAPSLSLKSVTIQVPKKNKIGGISFDKSGNVYVVFQDGTGGTGKGSIGNFAVTAGTPPTLSSGTTFATRKDDTPEFCLWVSDSNWPG
jgi:hypothetical protein